jgi:hypothetical protein
MVFMNILNYFTVDSIYFSLRNSIKNCFLIANFNSYFQNISYFNVHFHINFVVKISYNFNSYYFESFNYFFHVNFFNSFERINLNNHFSNYLKIYFHSIFIHTHFLLVILVNYGLIYFNNSFKVLTIKNRYFDIFKFLKYNYSIA